MTHNNHLNPLYSNEVLSFSDSDSSDQDNIPTNEDIEFIVDYFDFLEQNEDQDFVPEPEWGYGDINFNPWGIEWDWDEDLIDDLNQPAIGAAMAPGWLTADELVQTGINKRKREETAAEYHHLPHPIRKKRR